MPPLERAPVAAAHGDEKLIVVAEPRVGDVRAVAQVAVVIRASHVAGVPEQFDQAKVVRGGHHGAVGAAAARVDVRAVGVLRPHALHRPSEGGRPRVPLGILERGGKLDLLAPGNLPEHQLVITTVGLQITTVLAPVQVGDVAAVALAHADALEISRGVVHVHKVIVASHRQPPAGRRELDVTYALAPVLLGDELVPGVGVEDDEPAAEETRGDELSVGGVGSGSNLRAHVSHRDLPSLVHVVHAQGLIVARADELGQERVRGETP